MLSILQIIPTLSDGGAERFVVDLSNELKQQGAEVTLLVLYDPRGTPLHAEVQVPIVSLGKKPGFDLKCYLKLGWHIFTRKYDVIHSHTRALNYIPLVFLASLRRVFVHTMHNDAIKEEETAIFRTRRAILFRRRVVHPVTISSESSESFRNYYKLDSTLIPNGTRACKPSGSASAKKFIGQIRSAGGQHIFLNVARFSPQKNQLMLFKAFRNLEKAGIHLVVAGRYEGTDYYNSIAHEKPDNVHLLGSVPDVADYLQLCDGFVLGSLWEGMPISLLEAFAVGCVPVCTPAGGIPSMVSSNLGFISPTFSAADMTVLLQQVVKSKQSHLDELRKNCQQEFLKEYSILRCARRYSRLYHEGAAHPEKSARNT